MPKFLDPAILQEIKFSYNGSTRKLTFTSSSNHFVIFICEKEIDSNTGNIFRVHNKHFIGFLPYSGRNVPLYEESTLIGRVNANYSTKQRIVTFENTFITNENYEVIRVIPL